MACSGLQSVSGKYNLKTHLNLWRGPEAGEHLPDLPGDVHGGEDLVVDGRVRGLAWLTGLRVTMNNRCQEDDGQCRDDGHPDMKTLLTPDCSLCPRPVSPHFRSVLN